MAVLVTITVAGTLTYLSTAQAQDMREALATGDPGATTLEVRTRLGEEPRSQDHQVRSAATDSLPGVQITRTVRSPELRLTGDQSQIVLTADPGITEAAHLSNGSWPTGPGEGALPVAAARALEVDVGDEISIDAIEDPVRVTGLWQPEDPQANRWGPDELIGPGVHGSTYGPLVVPEETLTDSSVQPFARWVLAPPSDLAPRSLPVWISGLPQLQADLEAAEVAVRGLTYSGALERTLTQLESGLQSARGAAAVPLVVVAVVALVALWQLGRLLASVRHEENRLLHARGGSYPQLLRAGAVEFAVLMTLGAAAGAGVVLLAFLTRPAVRPGEVLLVAAAVALVGTALLTAVYARALTHAFGTRTEVLRSRQVVTSGALVVVAAGAAFTLWRFGRNGSPLLPGSAAVDPLAVAGPALALLAGAVAAVALTGPVLRGLAGRAARWRGYAAVATLRHTGRRITTTAAGVIMIVLATGVTTMAATYAGTWATLSTTAAETSNGADVRVQFDRDIAGGSPRGVARYAQLPEVAAVAPVVQEDAIAGDSSGVLTAVPASRLAVSSAPSDVLDADRAAALLAPESDPLPGLTLPEGAEQVALELRGSAGTSDADSADASAGASAEAPAGSAGGSAMRQADVRLVLWNGTEILTRTETGPGLPTGEGTSGQSRTADLQFDLPRRQGEPWRIVAVDVLLDAALSKTDYQVSIAALSAGGQDLLAQVQQPWDPGTLPLRSEDASVSPGDGPLSLSATTAPVAVGPTTSTGVETVRLMPPATVTQIPVLVTPGWSDRVLEAGTDLTVSGSTLEVRAAGTIPMVPGVESQRAVLADLATVQAALLRQTVHARAVSQVWVQTDSPQRVAGAAAELAGAAGQVSVAGQDTVTAMAQPARAVYWIAAAGALLLALPALVAVARAQSAERREEVRALSALGAGPVQQRRSRLAELLGLQLLAVLTGVVVGALVSLLVTTDLVRATAPQAPEVLPLPLSVAWTGGVVLLVAIVATLAVVGLWYARTVHRQATDTQSPEVLR